MESQQKMEETNNNNEQQNTSFDDYYNQLPKNTQLGLELVQHQGFWCWTHLLEPILSFQAHFRAQNTDLFITGMPKTGNTWLKSLVFATSHRHYHPISNSPLLHHNPHELVPIIEFGLGLGKAQEYEDSPRILSTHLPYEALPRSIKDSGCRIIYICRNPLDAFVSSWFFFKELVEKNSTNCSFPNMEEYFEFYLQGLTSYGPFFEHVLGYWKRSIEMPGKVLFLNYEELVADTPFQLKRISQFIGKPFTFEEEEGEVIEEIVKLCSIKNMKELAVNKSGRYHMIDNRSLFRKGQVGDWTNHLTPAMVDRMQEVVHHKFDGFKIPFSENWV